MAKSLTSCPRATSSSTIILYIMEWLFPGNGKIPRILAPSLKCGVKHNTLSVQIKTNFCKHKLMLIKRNHSKSNSFTHHFSQHISTTGEKHEFSDLVELKKQTE